MNPFLVLGVIAIALNYGIDPLARYIEARKNAEDFEIAKVEIEKEVKKEERAEEKKSAPCGEEKKNKWDWLEI